MFKKITIAGAMSTLLILGACGGANEEASTNNQGTQGTNQESSTNQETKKEEDSKQDDDGNTVLEKVGEIEESNGTTAELLALFDGEQPVFDGDFSVTINTVKIIKITEASEEAIQSIELNAMMDSGTLETPFTYLQTEYTVQNNTGKPIMWNEFEQTVVGKKQIDSLMTDFMVTAEEPSGTILSDTEYKGTQAIMIDNTDVDSIRYMAGTVYDDESYTELEKGKEVTVELER
ncbi:hypothetical protein ABFG93_20990 [Pseudalkalibacillus hwajinpoensis]|uniref:hypothetical protein n=1 Tax=Guptibacillus hwajinpoensis TaxID=208199 RepID=UPI00325BB334